MTHLHRSESEQPTGGESARQTLAAAADRIGRWFAGLDRRPEFDPGDDPLAELDPDTAVESVIDPADEIVDESASEIADESDDEIVATTGDEIVDNPGDKIADGLGGKLAGERRAKASRRPEPEPDIVGRFPLAPLGYNRQAVDRHLAELERELADLRACVDPPISITEELERIGEQTASILVVAHDKAHETTRIAEEQAERCIADAASNAVEITAEAKQRLRELDEETDAVWRERERLLDDVRAVSTQLATLADEAAQRFPADVRSPEEADVPAQG